MSISLEALYTVFDHKCTCICTCIYEEIKHLLQNISSVQQFRSQVCVMHIKWAASNLLKYNFSDIRKRSLFNMFAHTLEFCGNGLFY